MQGIGEITRNLLSLEINTIVSDGISAEKMPGAADALVDIAQGYHRFLCSRIAELLQAGCGIEDHLPLIRLDGAVQPFAAWRVETGGIGAFEALRRAATCCLAAGRAIGVDDVQYLDGHQHDVVLERIRRNSDQLKAMFQTLDAADPAQDAREVDVAGIGRAAAAAARRGGTMPLLALDQGDLVKIRKIWELSTEMVVMQTVVQIDGDLFNRIQSGWTRPEDTTLHALHRQAVELSFEHWSTLFKALSDVTTAVFQDFFRRRP